MSSLRANTLQDILLLRYTEGNMMSATFVLRWRQQLAPRELMRVEIVGLASEIETVAGRVDLDLPGDGGGGADQLRSRCRTHRENASAVLAVENRFEEWPEQKLVAALEFFRQQQRELVQLRSEADLLIHGCRSRSGKRTLEADAIQGS